MELWGAAKVAEVLGISKRALWRYAQLNRIPQPLPVEGNEWTLVWDADAIREWMAKR